MSNESTGLIVAGDLYLDRLTGAGASTGYMPVSNATQMSLNTPVEFQELSSRKKDTRGQLLASVPIPQPGEVNLTLDEINRENLAMQMLGESEQLDESAQTLTDEPVTLKGYNWTPIGARNLKDTGLSVSFNTTELVQGTDFEINYRLGLIRALRASEELTGEGDEVTVTAESNALTGSRINGATRPQIRTKLMLDGRNMVDDRPVIVEVFEANLRPNEAVDFLAEEFISLQMTGRMITPSGKTSPFRLDWLDAS